MQRNTDTVPAMLTPGEFVIRKDAAEQIGSEKLHMLNNIDRLSNSALLENAKSPVAMQEGGEVQDGGFFSLFKDKVGGFLEQQGENFKRAAMMEEQTGTRNPFLKTAQEQRALQRQYGLVPGGEITPPAPPQRPDVPIQDTYEPPEMLGDEEESVYNPLTGNFMNPENMSETDKVYYRTLPDLLKSTQKYDRYLDSLKALAEGQAEGDTRREELNKKYMESLGKLEKIEELSNLSLSKMKPRYAPEDESVGFLDYLFGPRTNRLLHRSLLQDILGPKQVRKGYNEGGEVSGTMMIDSDLYIKDKEVNGVVSSDIIENILEQSLDNPSNFYKQAAREYQRGDSIAGSEDSYYGSEEYQRDIYTPRFEVTEYGDGNERTVESKEQVSLGSLPILEKIADKAAEKGLDPESVIGKVLNLGLPLTRERKGGESKIRLGYNEGGEVMHNDELMSVFGEKSQEADGLKALAALIRMQEMQRAEQDATRAIGPDNIIPSNINPRTTPEQLEMLKKIQEPRGMMGGGYAKKYQQGGPVEPPMTGREPMMLEEPPMPMGEQAYYQAPADQLGLDPYEHKAYMKYGPDSFRYMTPNEKPRQQWTAYDALVKAGLVDPYEVDKDEVNVVTNDQMEELTRKAQMAMGS